MAERKDKKIKEFPEVENKLHAPTKKSLFERQKAEAEAKRLREEAETAAVLEDFVKSFDDEDVPSQSGFDPQDGGRFGNAGFSGPPKRHFTSSSLPGGTGAGRGFGGGRGGPMSGPGSLGPPPMSLSKKRTHESFQQERRRDERGLLAFDDFERPSPPSKALKLSDDEDENQGKDRAEDRAVAKPTLRLSSLPPATSPAVIKALLPSSLTVDAVRILPSTGPTIQNERKSMSAIVTLAKDTAANDIDAAVNTLQNRYLGYGYYLSLHRHLSSAAITTNTPLPSLGTSAAAHPFGAKPVPVAPAGRGHGPPAHQRGFAPPTSYAPAGPGQGNRGGAILHVPVQAPRDIKELKLIHKVIESLLTHGPEFEALLMSRPNVQREEKWAWLWDPRSVGGVWYRWRLWEVLTGSQTRRGQGKYLPLFEGSSAWKAPDSQLAYEYTTRLEEFVSDSEYNSSDEDDSGDEGARKQHHGGGPPEANALTDDGKAYLNPLEKAKLTHLLSRLPTSTGKLRKGDVARVTAFAISHAGRGADEVVQAIISNIEKPFAYTSANADRRKDREREMSGDDAPTPKEDEDSDTSSASLIGIYIISDILSSSSTSGVRHAWRYRQLFETALKQRHVFERLGRMEKKLEWGRLRAEKWKRSVGNMLSLWEGWCVFPQESQEHFVKVFNDPPLLPKDEIEALKKEALEKEKGKSRWKAVEVASDTPEVALEKDVDGDPMDEDDVDGEPMEEDEDIDGVPMDEESDGEIVQSTTPPGSPPRISEMPVVPPAAEEPPVAVQPRRRPRAVDMFADSDDEEN
ncbi:coatamer subunit protein [Phlyctema vagabunda]|uniref:Coatamer subunit protein n=1 Tax=Phlyctema vagabunda TaxID=108571 RepID=A0ABR4PC98_9HELO